MGLFWILYSDLLVLLSIPIPYYHNYFKFMISFDIQYNKSSNLALYDYLGYIWSFAILYKFYNHFTNFYFLLISVINF